jgi:transcriptional regulator with XRE-family HTH domain
MDGVLIHSARFEYLAGYLKAVREKNGLTYADIADRLGSQSAQFVSNWERIVSTPPMDFLKRLVKIRRNFPGTSNISFT